MEFFALNEFVLFESTRKPVVGTPPAVAACRVVVEARLGYCVDRLGYVTTSDFERRPTPETVYALVSYDTNITKWAKSNHV